MSNQNDILEAVYKVLTDYSSQELLIQEKLQNLQSKREENALFNQSAIPLNFETYHEAVKTKELALNRNKELKRELESSMGKLRSKRCYSPAEDNLHKIIQQYSEILSKPDIE